MPVRLHRAVALILLAAAGSAACSDSTPPSTGFVVSGTVQNNTGAPIPPNTRLLVSWAVTSGTPDYSYVFGEGSIDPSGGTFQIRFDQPPPAEALNTGGLGVGIIVATTNQTVGPGLNPFANVDPAEVVGAAGQYGVIFIADPNIQDPEWSTHFESGYGVGVGVPVLNDFDRFQPTNPSSVILIIDDLANIPFVNWT
jgi:hypothetical protein